MFLTLEDFRVKVQGSRDPLGRQPIWSRFGREVVTNLTSVTRDVRGFAVVLLGRYYGEKLIAFGKAHEENVGSTTNEVRVLSVGGIVMLRRKK